MNTDVMILAEVFESFRETALEKYYSILSNMNITDEEYEYAKEVWGKLKMKNLGELHDLYMNTDVMILADVFESFRETALEKYKFSSFHDCTQP